MLVNEAWRYTCTIQTHTHCEDPTPTCICQESADKNWEKEFPSEIGPTSKFFAEEKMIFMKWKFVRREFLRWQTFLKISNLWMRLSISKKRMAVQLRQPMLVNL